MFPSWFPRAVAPHSLGKQSCDWCGWWHCPPSPWESAGASSSVSSPQMVPPICIILPSSDFCLPSLRVVPGVSLCSGPIMG